VQVGKLTDGKWKAEYETRIRLDKTEYFSNSDKRLPYDILQWIDSELQKPNNDDVVIGGRRYSEWQLACWQWNKSFTNRKFTPPDEQPNYSSLQSSDSINASYNLGYDDSDELKDIAEEVITEESLLLVDELNRSFKFKGRKNRVSLESVEAEDLKQNFMKVNISITDGNTSVGTYFIVSFYGAEPYIEEEPDFDELYMKFADGRR
jgi:hypothetical protein